MKKLFLFMASTIILTLAGCKLKNNDNTNAKVPKGMVAADLSAVSEGLMQVLINVPDSTVGPLEMTPNPQGGVNIKVGKSFQITVTEGSGDIARKKQDITNDDVRKFIKYVVEEPNALVWEWQIEGKEPEFHFYAIVKAGEKTFEIQDTEGSEYKFSEKAVMDMLDAARSIRLKSAKDNS
jgi:hypothetical protein